MTPISSCLFLMQFKRYKVSVPSSKDLVYKHMRLWDVQLVIFPFESLCPDSVDCSQCCLQNGVM
jgi:hypothetical protein